MKFITSVQKIKEATEKASILCLAKNSLSITSCILIKASNGTLEFFSTDGKMEYYSFYETEVDAEGSVLVYADKLNAILKNLPSGDANFTLKDSTLSITMDDHPGLKVNMKTIDPKNFPSFDIKDHDGYLVIEHSKFCDMADHVVFASDPSRANLSGMFIHSCEGKLEFVATDGKVIALSVSEGNYAEFNTNSSVPVKFVNSVRNCCTGNVFISVKDNNVIATSEGQYICSPLVGNAFPMYRRLTEAKLERHAELNTTELMDAINLVNVMADDKSKRLYFTLDGNGMRIDSSNDNYGNTIQTVSCKYEGETTNAIFSFNVLTPCIKAIPKRNVTAEFNNGSTAWKFTTEDGSFVYVVMPMNR